jgi:hypothetical protein
LPVDGIGWESLLFSPNTAITWSGHRSFRKKVWTRRAIRWYSQAVQDGLTREFGDWVDEKLSWDGEIEKSK